MPSGLDQSLIIEGKRTRKPVERFQSATPTLPVRRRQTIQKTKPRGTATTSNSTASSSRCSPSSMSSQSTPSSSRSQSSSQSKKRRSSNDVEEPKEKKSRESSEAGLQMSEDSSDDDEVAVPRAAKKRVSFEDEETRIVSDSDDSDDDDEEAELPEDVKKTIVKMIGEMGDVEKISIFRLVTSVLGEHPGHPELRGAIRYFAAKEVEAKKSRESSEAGLQMSEDSDDDEQHDGLVANSDDSDDDEKEEELPEDVKETIVKLVGEVDDVEKIAMGRLVESVLGEHPEHTALRGAIRDFAAKEVQAREL